MQNCVTSPYNYRTEYIRNVAALKICYSIGVRELKEAGKHGKLSSAALTDIYSETRFSLINAHAEDLVSHGSLSGSEIKEISELSGVPIPDLIIELIKVFARPDRMVPGSVWLAFASFICPKAKAGQGQLALKRLLSDAAARLANNVADGPWIKGLYPPDDFVQIASGMIWRALDLLPRLTLARGPLSACVRKFDRWES